MNQNRATFYQVTTPNAKLSRIGDQAMSYFEKKEPLLIRVATKQAVEFIDELLWKMPKNSFLPHIVSDTKTDELIVITSSMNNPNDAKSIFNLTGKPLENEHNEFQFIYELEDLSTPQKAEVSKKAYKKYKALGYTVISL